MQVLQQAKISGYKTNTQQQQNWVVQGVRLKLYLSLHAITWLHTTFEFELPASWQWFIWSTNVPSPCHEWRMMCCLLLDSHIPGPESKTSLHHVSLYLRRWSPSSLQLGSLKEVVLTERTVDCLKNEVRALWRFIRRAFSLLGALVGWPVVWSSRRSICWVNDNAVFRRPGESIRRHRSVDQSSVRYVGRTIGRLV